MDATGMKRLRKLKEASETVTIPRWQYEGLQGDLKLAQSEAAKWERKYKTAIKVRDNLNKQIEKAYAYIEVLRQQRQDQE